MKLDRAELENLRENEAQKAIEGEVAKIGQPDHIDDATWSLIQDTGRLATEKLWQILNSPRFERYRPADQARLIKMAQDRAFGAVAAKKEVRRVNSKDVTAEELNSMAARAKLPEYKIEDAVIIEEKGPNDGTA